MNIINAKRNVDIPFELLDAKKINDYFSNSSNIPNDPGIETLQFYNENIRAGLETFSFKLITCDEILEFLHSIKTKAVGADGLSINMILYCCPFILPYLTHIINFCIEKNKFPTCWKLAHILPLPKTKSPTEITDLRPISILPVLSKLIEKVLNLQIRKHLATFEILPDTQSGFRPNHGCATALLGVTDDILTAVDNNQLTAVVLLDYSKAFDRINHRLLLAILHYYGFSENALAMMHSYISDRRQQVKLEGAFSSSVNVSSGVPQGSILGPLLFIIYTSNFNSYVKFCKSHCYADDYQLYLSFSHTDLVDACTKINADLETLLLASKNHSLTINPLKSTVLFFGKKLQRNQNLPDLRILINDEPLNIVNSARNLGLHIDYLLRYNQHINNCIRKAYANLKQLFGSRSLLNQRTKAILCDSLVLSHFNFADVVYHSCLTKSDALRIQRVQNSCARYIFGIRKYQSISHKIKELKWFTMEERRILHSCCLFHKVIKTGIPKYLI